MEPVIREGPVEMGVLGCGCPHERGRAFGEEIRALLDGVWPALRASGARHDGMNRVVYGEGCALFAGVVGELEDPARWGLERRVVRLTRHAWWRHVGPYRLLGSVAEEMRGALERRGMRMGVPMVEVYGHWDADETRLVTEVLVQLEG